MSDTVSAIPPPDGYIPDLVHPRDILHTINTVSMILAICFITPFVILRIYIRALVVRSFGMEEWTCVMAFIQDAVLTYEQLSFTGYWICGMFMNHFGAGYHLWEVTQHSFSGFQKSSYAGSILYSFTSFFTKASLLLLFIRVFAQFRKTVVFIWVSMAIMTAFCIVITIVKFRICTPIAGIWDPSIPHSCLNRRASFIADTAMAAITDLVILVPPIPLTWSLTMPLRKKIRIMGLLGAGGLATSTSFVRLVLLLRPGSFDDITVSFVRFNLLGVSEVGIGIICSCLPSLNILITRHTTAADPPGVRRYMFASILRHPGISSNILGLTKTEPSVTEVISKYDEMPEQGDLGMKSFVREHGWLGPYVSKAEKLV